MARTNNFKSSYNTVNQPAASFFGGLAKGAEEGFESDRKIQQLLAPKIMELQGRYGIEKMKQDQRNSEEQDKRSLNDKRDLQKQLHNIQRFYKDKKFSIKEKIASATDDSDMFNKQDPEKSLKVQKLKELYSQIEDSEMEDTKEILDQLKQYYK